MKYLFVLNHAHYLRNYGDVILALAERGHEPVLTFTAPRPADHEMFRDFFAGRGQVRLVEPPRRTGWWWAAADPIRALRDYAHYLNPTFHSTPRLVARAEERVPKAARALVGRRGASRRRTAFAERTFDMVERSLPPDPGIKDWLTAERPDAVLLSPLIDLNYDQLNILKAAKAIGVPTGHLVASWDNLSNKGRIQIPADVCVVWNELQRKEAVELHGFPAERVAVTGAQLYDHWFLMEPNNDRTGYCRAIGFDPERPIVLYAGSSPFICPNEVAFVRDWLKHIRTADDAKLRSVQIVLRPHPFHAEQWRQADLGALGPIKVSPEAGATPLSEADRQHYFDSLSHAAAVVGINTSVFLEAAIIGRPCLTVRSAMFDESQLGTLHFRHLVNGGLITFAPDFKSHLRDLGDAIGGRARDQARVRSFVQAFLRPHGIDRPVVPIATDVVEKVASMRPSGVRAPIGAPLVRAALAPVAAIYLRPRYLKRRARRPRAGVPASLGSTASRRGPP